MKLSLFLSLVLFALLCLAAQSFALLMPESSSLPNLDKRPGISLLPTLSTDREAAVKSLGERLSGLKVEFDPISSSPKVLSATPGFLTGPAGKGSAISAASWLLFAANDSNRVTKAFLQEHRAVFGYGPELLDPARVSRDYVTAHNGLHTVVWEQQLNGIPVFEAVLISHTTGQGELVTLSSQFIANLDAAAARGTPDRAALLKVPGVSARQAIALAAQSVGDTLKLESMVTSNAKSDGPEQRQQFSSPGLKGEADAKLIWLPMDKDNLLLCWEVILTSRVRGEMFRCLVDARGGEVILRRCLTSYISDASYRVYTSDSPSPFSPGWPTPNSSQPPYATRNLVTLPAMDTNASPAGWINDGGNETWGNNVDAHTDRNNDNLPDLPRPQGSPFRVFDFPMNLATQDPTNYSAASVVQLFYLCNWYHDKLYALGFTEAAGNFQSNNFARGGLGNDAVQADAQDGGGTDNANFSTPPDGSPGRMQMYIFSGPSPRRDGDLDAEIVFHEHTHGLSWRLVGGGQALGDLQSNGMGEGWSDFYGLTLLSEASDDVNGNYAAGGYATYLLGGLTQNYYFGIRRYPYSTDMTKNPLTLKDIDPAQASSHAGVPRSPIIGNTANEVHNEGEIWCVTLWEARAKLINKFGWAVGNQLMLQLVTDGMKLTVMHPNFLQARDGIIQADLVDTGGANRLELWSAFAKRGLGFTATSPASSTTTGIHEAFDLPDDLLILPGTNFVSRGPVGGPFNVTSQSYLLTNNGAALFNWSLANTSAWLNVSATNGSLSPGGAAASVAVSLNSTANSLLAGIYTASVVFSNQTSAVRQNRSFALLVGQPDYYTELFDVTTNDLSFQTFTFTPDGSSSYYSSCRQIAATFPTDPTGGTTLTLTDDSFSQITLSGASTVAIYNTRTNRLFIGSNGYLTMNSGDTEYLESPAAHFNRPRVSGLFDDLDPGSGGTISWKQLADRVAVTYLAVPEYGAATQTNSFQMELFFDGRIRLTCLKLTAADGLAGLSAGTGTPAFFQSSDLSAYGGCSPFALSLPGSAAENAGLLANAGTVSLATVLPTNLVVALTSSVPSRLTVPASATILAGQLYNSFDLTPVDNLVQDGNQSVIVTASAPGFGNVSSSILIVDDDTSPVIATNPASITVSTGGVATFKVVATGGSPLSYFWTRNGAYILGATSATYLTNNVQLADSGSQFSCLVSNAYGTALSSTGVLTVVTPPTDYFTELFGTQVTNVAFHTYTFTPDGSANFYTVCSQSASTFPTDPASGTAIDLSDDSFFPITLSGSNTVAIYNIRRGAIYVGSNGYLTMTSGDQTFTESYANHFALPRISALYRDLNPPDGGTITWKQLADRLAVTYLAVPIFGDDSQTNTFQIELFFDGRIQLTYLSLNTPEGLIGLSAGAGQPSNFAPSDFSAYTSCGLPLAPLFTGISFSNCVVSFTLSGSVGSSFVIQSSSNLVSWTAIATNVFSASGFITVSDSNACSRARQFYRAINANASGGMVVSPARTQAGQTTAPLEF